MRSYYSKTRRSPRVAPGEVDGPLLVLARPGSPWTVGIAYPSRPLAAGPGGPALAHPEQVWQLVLADLEGEVPLDGRYVLRAGRFVALAEDAR